MCVPHATGAQRCKIARGVESAHSNQTESYILGLGMQHKHGGEIWPKKFQIIKGIFFFFGDAGLELGI